MQQKLDLNELVNLNDLKKLLGYEDERSVKKWCQKNQVSLIELGKNKYIHRSILEKIILTEFEVMGSRAPINNNIPSKASKEEATYEPNNEIVSKYLTKYESGRNSQST